MNQLGLPFALNTKLLLDNIIGEDNQQLLRFIKALLGKTTNAVVYIKGAPSSGKTHCLQGCALAALDRGLSAVYIDFTQQLPADVLSNIGTPDWVCIDNVEYLDDNQACALFDLYNKIQSSGQKLIISSRYLPHDLKLLKDLKTRLSQALLFSLESLRDEDKIQVLEEKMRTKNLSIDPKIYGYLFNHHSRDLSEVLRLIKTLDKHSLQQKTKINTALIKQVLG